MENKTICVNNYIPYYPVHNDSLHETLLRSKYEKINENKEEYFENARIVNFDIINHECRQDPLKNSVQYYQTIKEEDLKCARKSDHEKFIRAAIKSERNDVNVARDVMVKHFRNNTDVSTDLIKFKQKNKILFSSMHGRKKKEEYDLAIKLYSHLKIK